MGRRQGMLAAFGVAVIVAFPALARDPVRPAELPPPDYAGQQYVDSRGCLFIRTGTPGNEIWFPRVTRKGEPLCGYPPSGRRVAVAGGGAATAPGPAAGAETTGAETASVSGGYFVAVGSFGVAANADKASARLKSLNYPVARGRMQGGSAGLVTVFAGPFDTAAAAAKARTELRGAGFPDAVVMGQ
jgi:hypothetical protein